MIELKVFGLVGKDWADFLEEDLHELKKRKKVYLETLQTKSEKIPKDFDVYIIHLSQTSEEAIENLRKNNEHAWIYVMSGGFSHLPERIKKTVNKVGWSFGPWEEKLKEIKEQYKC